MAKAQTLLPPALSEDETEATEAPRSLQGVGVQAVLGAMIEQRRASQVAAEELQSEEEEEPVPPTLRNGQEKKRRDPTSDVFLKAR